MLKRALYRNLFGSGPLIGKAFTAIVVFCAIGLALLGFYRAEDIGQSITKVSGDAAAEFSNSADIRTTLIQAATAAGYQVVKNNLNGEAQTATAHNEANGISLTFTNDMWSISSHPDNKAGWDTNWRLASLGFGESQNQVDSGKLETKDNRVEIQRAKDDLTEWFVNQPGGVEHGFTIASRPKGDITHDNTSPLRLVMKVGGDLSARISNENGDSVTLSDAAGSTALRYEKLKVWDATGSELSARMKTPSGGREIWLEVDESMAVYPVTIDPTFTQEGKLFASDGAQSDRLGTSVAISGDTAVVGAPLRDVSGNDNRGAAYVFVRSGTTWTQQAKLVASDSAANDNFGQAVAIAGDTVIVGSPNSDGPNENQGAAYVFTRSGTTWTQRQRLSAQDGARLDFFGYSVAMTSTKAVIGAYFDDLDSGLDHGSAYIFSGSGGSWTQSSKLIAWDGGGSKFGNAVSISDDRIVVGSYSSIVDMTVGRGAAYLFTSSGGQVAKLVAPDGDAGDNFGYSVAVSGNTVLVGSFGDDVGSNSNQGSAYVFSNDGTYQTKLLASDGAASDLFGSAVALSDGLAIVGAGRDDVGSLTDIGSAYVFSGSGATWTQVERLNPSDGRATDFFGDAIATSGNSALFGAIFSNVGATIVDQGAAYVFTKCPSGRMSQSEAQCESVLTVNTTDDGPDVDLNDDRCDADANQPGDQCTLRAAIQTANDLAGPDTIKFNIPGGGIQTITPGSNLPAIESLITLDGTTQPGYTNKPQIQINGSVATIGLTLSGGGNNVKGLAVGRFSTGIRVEGSNNTISSVFVGVDADGLTVPPAGSRQSVGIEIIGQNNKVAGTRTAGVTTSLITGNTLSGVKVQGSGNRVSGVNFGFLADGNLAESVTVVHIDIEGGSDNTIGGAAQNDANLLARSINGITIDEGASNNFVMGNSIAECSEIAIFVGEGSNTNQIGGTVASNERNYIFDSGTAIQIGENRVPSSGDPPTGNKIYGNVIGINNQTVFDGNDIGIAVLYAVNTEIGTGIFGQHNFVSNSLDYGISLTKDASGTKVRGNYIGTDLTGQGIAANENGVFVGGANNEISANIISGNNNAGVQIDTEFAGAPIPTGNLITNNRIGTNAGGTFAIPNGGAGISLIGNTNSVTSNTLSGNETVGLEIRGNNNSALNNKVGTNGDGTTAIANTTGGIRVSGVGNIVRQNQVSGNDTGIVLYPNPDDPAILPTGNTIDGNLVGTNADQTASIPNRTAGIGLERGSSNIISGNTVAGNGRIGIVLAEQSNNNSVRGNFIGVTPSGTPMPNGEHGIFITQNSSGNQIGSNSGQRPVSNGRTRTSATDRNTIAYNNLSGIALSSTAGNNNAIWTNNIFANVIRGIDIGGDGPTLNDPTDADVGPNKLQNYPTFILSIVGGDLIVSYQVDSAPEHSTYGANGIRVEFFEADTAGDGRDFLGSDFYPLSVYQTGTPGLRQKNLGNAAALGVSPGDRITATATDADGNSSEFTPAIALAGPSVTIGGRVATPSGQALRNAVVIVTSPNGSRRTATTSSFGIYSFADMPSGLSYTISVVSKRYRFAPRVQVIDQSQNNLDFVGLE